MFNTRIGRFIGFLVGIGLIVTAVLLYRGHREKKTGDVVQFDREVAEALYQERAMQTREILFEVGER